MSSAKLWLACRLWLVCTATVLQPLQSVSPHCVSFRTTLALPQHQENSALMMDSIPNPNAKSESLTTGAPWASCELCNDASHCQIPFAELGTNDCSFCIYLRSSILHYCGETGIDHNLITLLAMTKPRHDSHVIQKSWFPYSSFGIYVRDEWILLQLCFASSRNQRRDKAQFPIKIRPAVPLFSGEEESLTWAKAQLERCTNNHPEMCRVSVDTLLPTRVLDLYSLAASRHVKVHHSNGARARYLCLSYCWGMDQPTKLRLSNIDEYCSSGISLSLLPVSIREAIDFTIRLGQQYLWVDALCIIQDSDQDKIRELGRMSAIYEQAYLTLAVTKSADVHGGCYSSRHGDFAGFQLPLRTPDDFQLHNQVIIRRALPHFDHLLDHRDYFGTPVPAARKRQNVEHPLITRAWTLQEMLLSPRVLHFGPNELLWECRSKATCQCDDDRFATSDSHMYRRDTYKSSHFSVETWKSWGMVLQNYTRRSLSFQSDRFNALYGMAQRYEKVFQDQYIAGLWAGHLHYSLLWFLEQPSERRHPEWPSWSWLSAGYSEENPIRSSYPHQDGTLDDQVLDPACVMKLTTGNATERSSLSLQSALIIEWPFGADGFRFDHVDELDPESTYGILICEQSQEEIGRLSMLYFLIAIMKSSEGNLFERVGVTSTSDAMIHDLINDGYFGRIDITMI